MDTHGMMQGHRPPHTHKKPTAPAVGWAQDTKHPSLCLLFLLLSFAVSFLFLKGLNPSARPPSTLVCQVPPPFLSLLLFPSALWPLPPSPSAFWKLSPVSLGVHTSLFIAFLPGAEHHHLPPTTQAPWRQSTPHHHTWKDCFKQGPRQSPQNPTTKRVFWARGEACIPGPLPEQESGAQVGCQPHPRSN